jgi:hypothetical protein
MPFVDIIVAFYSKCLFIPLSLALLLQTDALNSPTPKFYFFPKAQSDFEFAKFVAHVL